MTITEAVKNEYYLTHAQSHGAIYTSRIQITPLSNSVNLRMTFNAQPQTILAKLMYLTMGFLFKGATKKALLKDLEDIKKTYREGLMHCTINFFTLQNL